MNVVWQMQSAQLKRLDRVKRSVVVAGAPLGPEMISFFQHSVQKRQDKLSKIADCWSKLVPEMFGDHCALESFARGNLTVLVDTSSHLYKLKLLLLSGLQQQLLLACKSTGIRKITLRPGRWYDQPDHAARKLRFE